jgi:hypothetical protein
MRKNLALCQDCLRVHRLCELVPCDNEPPGLCPVCTGATCDCPDCVASIDALALGEWDRARLQDHIRPVSWSPDGGLVEVQRSSIWWKP